MQRCMMECEDARKREDAQWNAKMCENMKMRDNAN